MVISKETLEKIRAIVDKNYSRLMISTLGRRVFSSEELKKLKAAGIDTSNDESFLSMVYHHAFLNNNEPNAPTSVEDARAQQSQVGVKPVGEAHEYTLENMNDKVRQLVEKLKLNTITRLEGIIRGNNDDFKMNALQNLDRSDLMDELVKESSLGKVKQKLRDTIGESNRDWQRVAVTEISNAIGLGSTDRIVTENREKDLDDVFVFRIPVADALTCKFCRRFYGESGEAPKVYRLSTLLSNGSNYGLRPDQYKPVVGATHPNERCSQIIELKPGFAVRPGGSVSYIGLAKWRDYINETVVA